MKLLTGNTFDFKDAIKGLGGKWDASCRGWRVPEHVYEELNNLCNGNSKPKEKLNTQIWEECPRCGNEPIYLEVGVCERCANKGRRA